MPFFTDIQGMKRIISLILIMLCVAAFSAAQSIENGLFRQEGVASWYGKEFEGRPTASGEIFNPALYTAAHPTLPFGTILTVTNKYNMRQVTVRVNDRGPFVSARIIDLSRAAAEALDMVLAGTVQVIVEQAQSAALGPVPAAPVQQPAPVASGTTEAVFDDNSPRIINIPPQNPAPPVEELPELEIVNVMPDAPMVQETYPIPQITYNAPAAVLIGNTPSPESSKYYRLQVGSFKVPRNAIDALDVLKNVGLMASVEQYEDFYRVVLPGVSAKDIPAIAQMLGNTGFREVLVREEG